MLWDGSSLSSGVAQGNILREVRFLEGAVHTAVSISVLSILNTAWAEASLGQIERPGLPQDSVTCFILWAYVTNADLRSPEIHTKREDPDVLCLPSLHCSRKERGTESFWISFILGYPH